MYQEILDKKRKDVFEVLKKLSFIGDFDLGGGTALALQIGHRVSVDFDFFTKDFLESNFLKDLERELPSNSLELNVNSREELTFFFDGVKVTFLHYPYPRLLSPVDLEGVTALNVLEIASTKAYTVGRRVEYKDYIDLYFVLKEQGISLGGIIDLSNRKYGSKFNSRLFLEQLVDDSIEEVPIKFIKNPVPKGGIFKFFEGLVSDFKRNL